jgi:hypothetical protein
MAGCGHTAEQHQQEIRDLLRKNDPEFAAWLEGGQPERIAIAALPWEPLDPSRPRLVDDPALTSSRIRVVLEDDWDEQDEQDWMNEIRTDRHRAQ